MDIINWIISILLLGILGFFIGKFIKHKSLYPFMPFRYNFKRRRNTFKKTLELLSQTKAQTIIETGTSREGLKGAKSNGAATLVFGKWARENNAELHSVDISQKSVDVAQQWVEKCNLTENVQVHLSDSVAFLEKFDNKVDLLYLDSFDYTPDRAMQIASQEHHLKEFIAIQDKLHKDTIVLIDDCKLPGGGKGKMVIKYMQEQGWKILIESYQVLLLHKDSMILQEQ